MHCTSLSLTLIHLPYGFQIFAFSLLHRNLSSVYVLDSRGEFERSLSLLVLDCSVKVITSSALSPDLGLEALYQFYSMLSLVFVE